VDGGRATLYNCCPLDELKPVGEPVAVVDLGVPGELSATDFSAGADVTFNSALLLYVDYQVTDHPASGRAHAAPAPPVQQAPKWAHPGPGPASLALKAPFRPPAVVAAPERRRVPTEDAQAAVAAVHTQDAGLLDDLTASQEVSGSELPSRPVAGPVGCARIPGPASKFTPAGGEAAPPVALPPPAAGHRLSDAQLLASLMDDDDADDQLAMAMAEDFTPAHVPQPPPQPPPQQPQPQAMPGLKRLRPGAVPAPSRMPAAPSAPGPHTQVPVPPVSLWDAQSMHPSGACISFPTAAEVSAAGGGGRNGGVERLVVVPDTLADGPAYARTWVAALVEEIRVRLTAGRGDAAVWHATTGPLPRDMRPQQMEAATQRSGLRFLPRAELSAWLPKREFRAAGRAKKVQRRGGDAHGCDSAEEDEEDEEAEGDVKEQAASFTLSIPKTHLQKSSAYSKGDLWVLSTSQWVSPGRVGDWAVMAVSLWHAPKPNDGSLPLQLLGPRPPGFSAQGSRKVVISALHCRLNIGLELDQLNALSLLLRPAPPPPVLPALLGAARGQAAQPGSVTEDLVREDSTALSDVRLNADQARVVAHLTRLARAPSTQAPTITLVHGPFGCGKTHTLAAAVRAVLSSSSTHRILLAAVTNAAVDRMLSALLASGFDDIVRVGRIAKIAPVVLPYALSADRTGGAKRDAADISDLRQLLAQTRGSTARRTIQTELDARLSGGANLHQQRTKRLATCRCVATTLASAACTSLEKQTFSIAFVDEASQATEPQSALPALLLGVRHLVLVGDPQQLPPHVEGRPVDEARATDISRPLFVRLQQAGCPVHVLRTQYRMHPALSAIPNAAFYDNCLIDGVTPADRPPVVSGLPHLVFVDLQTMNEPNRKGHNDSPYNCAEVRVVSRLVVLFTGAGVGRGDIAVVTPYVAQANEVRRVLGIAADAERRDDAVVADEEGPPDGAGDDELLVNTVDALQGQERKVVILSLCGPGSRSFATHQRINVALTRATTHLLVLGRAQVLRGEGWWDSLLRAARGMPGGYVVMHRVEDPWPLRWGGGAGGGPPPPPRAPPPQVQPEPPHRSATPPVDDDSIMPAPPSPAADEDAVMAAADDPLPAAPALAPSRLVADGSWNNKWGSSAWTGSASGAPSVGAGQAQEAAVTNEATSARHAGEPEGQKPDPEAAFQMAGFTSADLWDARKQFNLYSYSNFDERQKEMYLGTSFGRIMGQLYPHKRLMAQALFLKLYGLAEQYVSRTEGPHSVRLASLLGHEDMPMLRLVCPAFAAHVEQEAADEDEEDARLDYLVTTQLAARWETPKETSPQQGSGAPASPIAPSLSEENYLF
jgi:hypothetical protein